MKTVLAFCCVVTSSLALHAADLVHAPVYNEGQVLVTETELSIDQTLVLAGMNIETGSEQFMIIAETVESVTPQGVRIRGKLDTLQVDLSLPGGVSYSFSSENPNAGRVPPELAPVADLFKVLAEAEWIQTLDSDGKMTAMDYVGDPFSGLDPSLQSEFDSEKHLREAQQQYARLPGNGIEPGQSWKRTEVMNLGSGQEFQIEREFTYVGSEEIDGRSLERVDVKSVAVTYTMQPNPNLPLTLKSSDLTIETQEGAFWYDPVRHTIVKGTETFHITGELELEIMGNAFPGELDLSITTRSVERRD